jgi:enoyl-CoA hydratase/carnithine racemase
MRDAMLAESWFTHDEAVEAGLADEAVKPDSKAKAEIDPPTRFTDQLEEAVASFEDVIARAEDVITFRVEQGKPPLSDEAVALVEKAKAALTGLQAEPEPADTPVVSDRRRDLDLLDSENQVALQQLGIS